MSTHGRGRPPGKHIDPDYIMTSAYVRRSVHDAVKKKLADRDGDFSDFTQLVEETLLDAWLAGR